MTDEVACGCIVCSGQWPAGKLSASQREAVLFAIIRELASSASQACPVDSDAKPPRWPAVCEHPDGSIHIQFSPLRKAKRRNNKG